MGEGGIFKQLTQALVERCLRAELDHHLKAEKAELEVSGPRNRRNGTSKKTIKGEFGEAEIGIPRDRNGSFEPHLIEQGQTRFTGFDGKILSLYARGMTTRDIQAQLQDLYGVNVSHWEAYETVIPSKRYRAVGKDSGQTNRIVRASVAKQNVSTVHYVSGYRD